MRKAHLFTLNKHPVRTLAHLVYYEVLKKSGEICKQGPSWLVSS